MAEGSILQKEITLAELVDADSFVEVMRSFAELYRVGLKVFDAEGTKLVDVRVGNGPFCGYLYEYGESRQACTRLVSALKNEDFSSYGPSDKPSLISCFTGLRYVILPICYEGDVMGRLIFGPYAPVGLSQPDEELYRIEPRLNREKSAELMQAVRHAPDDVVAKSLEQLQRVIEVILFTSYRALLTSQMHIESVTGSYRELQEKARTLREANERLQELDKLKSNFLATVSHELRTPLTSVIGYSEMLLEGMAGELNEEQREYVGTIMEKGETLLGLIGQILDVSRVESGNLRMHIAEVDLQEVLRRASTSVVPQAAKKEIALDFAIEPHLKSFPADGEKIGQVLVNLLGNAVKFTPQGGTVRLRADYQLGGRRTPVAADEADDLFGGDDERFVRIVVEDTGVGIPADKCEAVFDRFFQVDNTSTREFGGTGLGLSIVKSFVEGHGGDVWCESDTGKGAKFTILLPTER
ncbi:MAG: ATP-binding protein [Myxococcota bacterium]